jgi:hypothetical protein
MWGTPVVAPRNRNDSRNRQRRHWRLIVTGQRHVADVGVLRQQIFRCKLGTTPVVQIAKTGLSRQAIYRVQRDPATEAALANWGL